MAGALLVLCEVEVIADLHGHRIHNGWPLIVNLLLVAGLTVPFAWRRRAPLLASSVMMMCLVVLAVSLSNFKSVNSPQLLLFVVPYSVAAYSTRNRALLGLALSVAAVECVNLTGPFEGATSWVFSMTVLGASWAIGRSFQARRASAVELQLTSERIAAEREGRELLAIAEQRTRIARELQTLVAHSVTTMIVQTQAAQRLLERSPVEADAAMETIEDTGRRALSEMRRILGVLRHPEDQPDLAPQPGVGQIAALVERARQTRPDLALHVEGEPGPLPASVDIGVYRILEDALTSIEGVSQSIEVRLRFGADDVELSVACHSAAHLDWPTLAMRERVALCQGVVDVDSVPGAGERLVIRLPRAFDGVLA